MDAAPAEAPPVVAVVVTCDPGWWLEPCVAALAGQDYPQLAILVIDAGSADDPTPRIAEVAPSAYVRRVRRRRGFGAAANEVLETVEGAAYYLVCHDDVAPSATAVRLLVEEATRSNAGIVAPKLVEWAEPDRLLAAGMWADRFGIAVPLVEPGELDQQQHDAVRDVFFAPGACALVRADLFTTLGGFDVGVGLVGEDLDLGWRAHLAGARVVFAPGARVRHLEATERGRRAIDGGLRDDGPPVVARAGVVDDAVSSDAVVGSQDAGPPLDGAGAGGAEPGRAEPGRAEPGRAEPPAALEPADIEPADVEPAGVGPATALEPRGVEPSGALVGDDDADLPAWDDDASPAS